MRPSNAMLKQQDSKTQKNFSYLAGTIKGAGVQKK